MFVGWEVVTLPFAVTSGFVTLAVSASSGAAATLVPAVDSVVVTRSTATANATFYVSAIDFGSPRCL